MWAVARWAEGRPTVRFVGCRHAAQEVDWANPEEPHAPGVPVPTRKPSVARTARPTASPSVAPTLAWPTNAPVDYDTHSPSENTSTAAAQLERDKERYEKHAAQEPDWVRPDKPRAAINAVSALHRGGLQQLAATACTCRACLSARSPACTRSDSECVAD